ncbi:ABC-2 type transport system permease protein [Microbacterium sp. cf046]|uniref:ABC transporter permease n=1 Tax=Microbacterium sp. cf046 TaxID=1761803 RepID=UPI0008EF4586|nr:polyketide antibiotic transporter [Microbacterium sp. cf046]SFS13463.1 ABC-2 type transport system permease protein [Microbacterium sp. cf046]
MSVFTTLLRERIRRDRWQLLMWIVGTALLAYTTYVGVTGAYGTEQDRQALLATAIANPVIMLFRGLPSGAAEGAFMLFLIFPYLAMLAAFMSTFLAVRHTRMDEEQGRAELVAATPAGRTLPFLATLTHGILANLALALLTALALIATGLAPAGSFVAGFGAGAVGISFLGIGLLAGQLMRTSRGANSLAVWVLLLTFLIGGIGNAVGTPTADLQRIESSWLTWLSPFGWGENSRPFADDEVWPLLLCAAFGLALAAVSLALQQSRDLGASLVPERRGRVDASGALAGPTTLVWRLTRGSIIGWCVGGLLTGLLATSLAGVLSDVVTELPSVEAILSAISANGSIEQGAIVIFFEVLGILAACAAVQTVCRARQDEANGTAEPVLATPVDRVRWLAGYVSVGFAAIVLVVASAAIGAALGIAGRDGDWSLMGDVSVVGAGQVVAASVFLVLTALVFVVAPRLTIPLGWTLVMLAMILGLFGPLFGFPDWLVHVAPIAIAPTVTGDGIDLQGLWWLLLAIVALGGAATVLMRRRELAPAG